VAHLKVIVGDLSERGRVTFPALENSKES
jgi:hypothetical protein